MARFKLLLGPRLEIPLNLQKNVAFMTFRKSSVRFTQQRMPLSYPTKPPVLCPVADDQNGGFFLGQRCWILHHEKRMEPLTNYHLVKTRFLTISGVRNVIVNL